MGIELSHDEKQRRKDVRLERRKRTCTQCGTIFYVSRPKFEGKYCNHLCYGRAISTTGLPHGILLSFARVRNRYYINKQLPTGKKYLGSFRTRDSAIAFGMSYED